MGLSSLCACHRRTLLGAASSALAAAGAWGPAHASLMTPGIEPRQRLLLPAAAGPGTGAARVLALTFDACGGAVDETVLATLRQLQVPATLFVTRRWLRRHQALARALAAEPALFDLQNHGAEHVPATIGRSLYGMRGAQSLQALKDEIDGGREAIEALGLPAPHWYRGAGARYDRESLALLAGMGLQVAGYSLNGDDGATASAASVARRLRSAQPGDIVLLHMNKPASGTGAALAQALPHLLQQQWRFVQLSKSAGVRELPAAGT